MTTRARTLPTVIATLALLASSGCSSLSYYWQAAGGHIELMRARVPIADVLADAAAPATLKAKLEIARSARAYAVEVIGLPDNGSYTRYADIGRPYLLWNVVAAPELSLQPKRWCMPIAGCVSYRGYFEHDRARAVAADLRAQGLDVTVGGVAAYSTLGWFEDPVINTMTSWPNHALAAVVIHELAHQQAYVKDDSGFNEAFATAVAELGLDGWLAGPGREAERQAAETARARRREFVQLVARCRDELTALYASDASDADKRAGKLAAFARLRKNYTARRAGWGSDSRYDAWFEDLNNAKLAAVSTYYDLVPQFKALFAAKESNWPRFFAAIDEATKLKREARRAWLQQWTHNEKEPTG